MLEQLPRIEIPNWLTDLTASSMKNGPFPLRKLIINSLYYPCSGFDGGPIEHLGGNIVSFLYVDYGYSEEKFMIQLRTIGFRGYHELATRKVTKKELTPSGWQPKLLLTPEDNLSRAYCDAQKPFFIWTVLQRNCDYSEDHGPVRFSLLYLCSDAVATFHALYLTNKIAPKAVAIIQQTGRNWTDLRCRNKIFARYVIDCNPGGCPEYLLDGGDLESPCWPEYERNVCSFNSVGIWERSAEFATEKNSADGLTNS